MGCKIPKSGKKMIEKKLKPLHTCVKFSNFTKLIEIRQSCLYITTFQI